VEQDVYHGPFVNDSRSIMAEGRGNNIFHLVMGMGTTGICQWAHVENGNSLSRLSVGQVAELKKELLLLASFCSH
jgi:hypothetical protein